MGAILSLWDQDDSDWDRLPSHLKRQIYRETNADRELAVERLANAPGGYEHWLRTSPIGPELVRRINTMTFTFGATERGRSLILRDIVQKIARFEVDGGDPLGTPVRRAINFRLRLMVNPAVPGEVRLAVQFVVEGAWSPHLYGRWFSVAELNT